MATSIFRGELQPGSSLYGDVGLGKKAWCLLSAWLALLRPLEASAFGFPALLDGEYRHSRPQAKHLEHKGLALEHLTLAKKQPSQDARRRGGRVLELEDMMGGERSRRRLTNSADTG